MKKIFLVLVTAGVFCFGSCNSKDEKKVGKDEKEEVATKDDPEEEPDNISKAATAYCNCFNENVDDLNPKLKKILKKIENKSNPEQALQTELLNIEDEQERSELALEFQQWTDNKAMEACSNKVKAKYKINENDPKTKKAILKKLEESGDCPLLTSVIKMTMNQKTDDVDDEEAN